MNELLQALAAGIVGGTIVFFTHRTARKYIYRYVDVPPLAEEDEWPDPEALARVSNTWTPTALIASPRRIGEGMAREDQLAAAHICAKYAEQALGAARVFTYQTPAIDGEEDVPW